MKTTKQKIQIAGGLVVFGLLFGAYSFYDFISHDVAKWEKQRRSKEMEVTNLKSELSRVSQFADNIQNIKQEFRELNLQLESALEYMPRDYQLAQLLRKMTLLAENSGVEIAAFRPQKNDETIGFYNATDIEFTLKGGFTQTLVFFDQLSRLKRVLRVQTLKLAAEERAGRAGTIPTITTAMVRTYRLSQ